MFDPLLDLCHQGTKKPCSAAHIKTRDHGSEIFMMLSCRTHDASSFPNLFAQVSRHRPTRAAQGRAVSRRAGSPCTPAARDRRGASPRGRWPRSPRTPRRSSPLRRRRCCLKKKRGHRGLARPRARFRGAGYGGLSIQWAASFGTMGHWYS